MIDGKITDFLNQLVLPEKKTYGHAIFELGASFEQDENIRRIKKLVSGKFSKRHDHKINKNNIQEILFKGKILSVSVDSKTKFTFFILLINNYFNAHANTVFQNSDFMIKLIAKSLNLDIKDYQEVLDFYSSHEPYLDNQNSIYISGQQENRLVKSKGVNVHFIAEDSDNIIYLKYFKNFDTFLSKTFHKYRAFLFMQETIGVKEINLMTSENFQLNNFISFEDLKRGAVNKEPLQYIKVKHTEFTPKIILDPHLRYIKIIGNSRPLPSTFYFDPIFEWIHSYGKHGKKQLSVHFEFQNMNTYTMHFLLKMIRLLNHYCLDEKDINVIWVYDHKSDDLKEFGNQLYDLFIVKENFLLSVEFEGTLPHK